MERSEEEDSNHDVELDPSCLVEADMAEHHVCQWFYIILSGCLTGFKITSEVMDIYKFILLVMMAFTQYHRQERLSS